MKRTGISLITLIVTIIVIIILAGSVILTITKNNPIENAKEASFRNDVALIQEQLNLYVQNQYLKTNQEFNKNSMDGKVSEFVPEITKYDDEILVEDGELIYIGSDEKKAAIIIELGGITPNERIRRELEAKISNLKTQIVAEGKIASLNEIKYKLERDNEVEIIEESIKNNAEDYIVVYFSNYYFKIDYNLAVYEDKENKYETVISTVPNQTGSNSRIFASKEESGNEAWKAFNGNLSGAYGTYWCDDDNVPAYIGYDFRKSINVKTIRYMNYSAGVDGIYTCKIQYCFDGDDYTKESSWHDTIDGIFTGARNVNWQTIKINDTTKARYWRLYIMTNGGSRWTAVRELQIDFEEKIKVNDSGNSGENEVQTIPLQTTSNSRIFASKEQSGNEAWKAFNGDLSGTYGTYWCDDDSAPAYIGYNFGKNVNIESIEFMNYSSGIDGIYTCKLQYCYGGDDYTKESSWHDTIDGIFTGARNVNWQTIKINDTTKAQYWRLYIMTNGGSKWTAVRELQFYYK